MSARFAAIAPSIPDLPGRKPAPTVTAGVREDALAYTGPAPIAWCACFDGMCRCEVVAGRTSTGARCKASTGPNLREDC